MAAGEGIETILSLRQVMPTLPMISGLSGAHLAAIAFPDLLKRLYVARDDDPAGDAALATLSERASQCGIDVLPLEPRHGDFNGDLRAVGRAAMAASLRSQLLPADRLKFL